MVNLEVWILDQREAEDSLRQAEKQQLPGWLVWSIWASPGLYHTWHNLLTFKLKLKKKPPLVTHTKDSTLSLSLYPLITWLNKAQKEEEEKKKLKRGVRRSKFMERSTSPQKQTKVQASKRSLKEKRARLYIIKRCVFMLLCWREHAD